MRFLMCLTALAILVAVPAAAKEISIKGNSESELKDKCKGTGTFSPSSGGGAYACVGNNGSVVACGGSTPHDKQTCTVSDHTTPGTDPRHRPVVRGVGSMQMAPANHP